MKIDVLILSKNSPAAAPIKRLCGKLLRAFSGNPVVKGSRPKSREKTADLTVVFIDKKKARQLNRQYRGLDRPTDILSFAPEETGQGLGELILCEPLVRVQAKEHGLSFKKEVDYLLIHGFLHLLGYDHEASRQQERKMMRLQDRLFEKLSLKD